MIWIDLAQEKISSNMNYQFPEYDEFDIDDYDLDQESLLMAMIKKHCNDVEVISYSAWQDYQNYEWLDRLILSHLTHNKKIVLFPNEERFISPPNDQAKIVLNKYQHEPVWIATQLSPVSQKLYTYQHQLEVKLLELPYVMLELCETYYKLRKSVKKLTGSHDDYNYLCMTGGFRPHRGALIQAIHDQKLEQYGLITLLSDGHYPQWLKKLCKINTVSPPQVTKKNYSIRNNLVDGNVQNFLYIEQTYSNIPLVIHAETSCGIFYCTEKTLWPLLLGKLCLCFGPPGNMHNIQRFYDLEISMYADLDYDNPPTEWSDKGHEDRINIMLTTNEPLIKNAKSIHQGLHAQLESARWTLGKNFYNFSVHQLNQIF